MYRQGDILIVKKALPGGLKEAKDKVIAYGEVTGHSHKVVDAMVLEDPKAQKFISAAKQFDLVHDEHNKITIPEGDYWVIRQREYDENEIRYVED